MALSSQRDLRMRFTVKYTTKTGEVLLKDYEGVSADEVDRKSVV